MLDIKFPCNYFALFSIQTENCWPSADVLNKATSMAWDVSVFFPGHWDLWQSLLGNSLSTTLFTSIAGYSLWATPNLLPAFTNGTSLENNPPPFMPFWSNLQSYKNR